MLHSRKVLVPLDFKARNGWHSLFCKDTGFVCHRVHLEGLDVASSHWYPTLVHSLLQFLTVYSCNQLANIKIIFKDSKSSAEEALELISIFCLMYRGHILMQHM